MMTFYHPKWQQMEGACIEYQLETVYLKHAKEKTEGNEPKNHRKQNKRNALFLSKVML